MLMPFKMLAEAASRLILIPYTLVLDAEISTKVSRLYVNQGAFDHFAGPFSAFFWNEHTGGGLSYIDAVFFLYQ